MASLRKRTRGGSLMFEIDFYTNGQRKTIPLGVKYAEKTAENLLEIVEMLLRCKDNGVMVLDKREQTRMQTWIETAPQEIRQKLAKAGLIEIPESRSLGEVWDLFLKTKELDRKVGKIKEATISQYEIVKKRFFDQFKKTDCLTDLSKEALVKWKSDLLTRLKPATVASTLKHCKSVFTWTVEQGWIEKSPLAGIGRGSFINRSKDRLITIDEYYRLLDSSPCQDWRTIISLVRIGGLRCPSEVVALRWEDVDWERNRFCVRSPKTEHHEGKESRVVPLFDELKEELETLFFMPDSEGKEFVINRYRDPKQNLGTMFEKIVKRAGLSEIPRPFDNMRMTRSNEVYNRWGAYKESQWIGHSARVRQDHYMMITDDDYLNVSESGGFPATDSKRRQSGTGDVRRNQPEIVGQKAS